MEVDLRTLERWFNESFSTTPKAWLVHERITAALPLLTRGLSNKEVANRLGYTRSANFGRDFTRVLGSTPRKYLLEKLRPKAVKPIAGAKESVSRFEYSR